MKKKRTVMGTTPTKRIKTRRMAKSKANTRMKKTRSTKMTEHYYLKFHCMRSNGQVMAMMTDGLKSDQLVNDDEQCKIFSKIWRPHHLHVLPDSIRSIQLV